MAYHSLKIKSKSLLFDESPFSTATKFIIFLKKILLFTETRYWPTELKMAGFVWMIQKLHLIVLNFKLSVIIFINHSANLVIVWQTKLVTANTAKQNLQFIRVSMYLLEFNLWILYYFGKFYTIPNALS